MVSIRCIVQCHFITHLSLFILNRSLKDPFDISSTASLIVTNSVCTTMWSSETSCRAASTSLASESLPFMMSHRGDSGRPPTNTRIRIQKKHWKAIGNRQATEPAVKEKPRSTQLLITKYPALVISLQFVGHRVGHILIPPAIKAPSIITSLPRLWAFDVSDCHVGTVEVFPPFPIPVMMRPIMNCSSVVADACSAAPKIMIEVPIIIIRFRPSGLPMKMVKIAPIKQPRL
jgi:hypothetical protein